jgi:hypothetical protein
MRARSLFVFFFVLDMFAAAREEAIVAQAALAGEQERGFQRARLLALGAAAGAGAGAGAGRAALPGGIGRRELAEFRPRQAQRRNGIAAAPASAAAGGRSAAAGGQASPPGGRAASPSRQAAAAAAASPGRQASGSFGREAAPPRDDFSPQRSARFARAAVSPAFRHTGGGGVSADDAASPAGLTQAWSRRQAAYFRSPSGAQTSWARPPAGDDRDPRDD